MTAILLNEAFIRWLLIALAIATPLAALALHAVARRDGRPRVPIPQTVLIALAGPAILLAWTVYNRVVAIFDLDSLTGLGVNFALFTVFGVAAGIAWRRYGAGPEA